MGSRMTGGPTWKLSKMFGRTASSRLRYRDAFLTGAVLLWRMSETRKRRDTLVGGGVSARVRDSVRISTICHNQVNMLSKCAKGHSMLCIRFSFHHTQKALQALRGHKLKETLTSAQALSFNKSEQVCAARRFGCSICKDWLKGTRSFRLSVMISDALMQDPFNCRPLTVPALDAIKSEEVPSMTLKKF